jgi:hypothetical protein
MMDEDEKEEENENSFVRLNRNREKRLLDHNIISKTLQMNKHVSLNLLSINLCQIAHLRTMTMHNKLHCFLRTINKEHYISQPQMNHLFENMKLIIIKHDLHKEEIKVGSKKLVVDPDIIHDMVQYLPPGKSIEYMYIRRYVPKENSTKKNDKLFCQRFQICNFIYFDIIFKEESLHDYQTRVVSIFKLLEEKTNSTSNTIICLQEVNPILSFYEIICKHFPCFTVVDPKFSSFEYKKVDPKLFTKSVSCLLKRNFGFRITKVPNDNIIDFFAYNSSSNRKNNMQNIKYFIPKFNLYLYNIHGYLFNNKKITRNLNSMFAWSEAMNIIIIGDFNWRLNDNYMKIVKTILEKENVQYSFYRLPMSSNLHEGIMTRIA